MKARPYPTPDDVKNELGDKVLDGLARSVDLTRSDYREYRDRFPHQVMRSSPRGRANWIHDQLWAHCVEAFDGNPDIVIVEKGPVRELMVHGRLRIRLKKHTNLGEVRSYPTRTAMAFMSQPSGTLPGMETVHLVAGYVVDADTGEIGAAVLSLHDGEANPAWMIELEAVQTSVGVVEVPATRPEAPSIVVRSADDQDEAKGRM